MAIVLGNRTGDVAAKMQKLAIIIIIISRVYEEICCVSSENRHNMWGRRVSYELRIASVELEMQNLKPNIVR